jgi:hypothetical protein
MRWCLTSLTAAASALAGTAALAAPELRTPTAPAVAAPAPEQRASAVVFLERPGRLDGEEILSEYVVRWRSPARLISARGERILADLGDALGVIHARNEPLNEYLTDKAVRATWQWAAAGRVVHRHRAHLLVEVRSPRGDGIANARRLTRLVAALLVVRPALAVLWNHAGMLVESSRFLVDSETTVDDRIPIGLWLNFLPAALSPHLPVVHTMGLAPLGFRELVLYGHRTGPEGALATLTQVAERVLQGRLTLRPGGSFRTDARDTLYVQEIPAPWDEKERAFQLTPRASGRR